MVKELWFIGFTSMLIHHFFEYKWGVSVQKHVIYAWPKYVSLLFKGPSEGIFSIGLIFVSSKRVKEKGKYGIQIWPQKRVHGSHIRSQSTVDPWASAQNIVWLMRKKNRHHWTQPNCLYLRRQTYTCLHRQTVRMYVQQCHKLDLEM